VELPKCVNCREPINERDLFEVIRNEPIGQDTQEGSQPEISLRRINSRSSAKIEVLVKKLKQIEKEDPGTKSCIFSQFTSFIDLIEPALERYILRG
jgi:DNA repair protein RAD5